MKRFITALACAACVCGAAMAQNVVNSFIVGPYNVDYYDNGDYNFRLRDGIDIKKFFGIEDQPAVVETVTETVYVDKPGVDRQSGIQIDIHAGTAGKSGKDVGIGAAYKYGLNPSQFLNIGVELAIAPCWDEKLASSMLEIGVPLQWEYGKISSKYANLYVNAGLKPAFYSTLKHEVWGKEAGQPTRVDGDKVSGLLVSPIAEFGANVPVAGQTMRFGFYFEYKINCTKDDKWNPYQGAARAFVFGGRLGFVF